MPNLTPEEKLRRSEERKRLRWERTHRLIDDVDHKICKICEEWFPATEDYFYKNKSNKLDGLHPYCRECGTLKSRKYWKENIDAYRERTYNHYQSHKEQYQTRKREWYKENQEHAKIYTENYMYENPDKFNQYREQHRQHDITEKEWEDCKKYFEYKCAYCGLDLKDHFITYVGELKWTDFHKEHNDHAGENDLSNCIPSCKSCNVQKNTLDFEMWYEQRCKGYSEERHKKIIKWLSEDYKLFINRTL